MDDSRIRQLTDEVFAQLQKGPAPSDLEERLAALETAVARLSAVLPVAAPGVEALTSGGRQPLAT